MGVNDMDIVEFVEKVCEVVQKYKKFVMTQFFK